MSGLATYEIFKSGVFALLICCCLGCAIYLTITNINKNYVPITNCNVVSNNDDSYTQVLTYIVNGKVYNKNIPPKSTTNSQTKVTTYNFAYPTGLCTVYVASANPDDYSFNYNPTIISEIVSGSLACCALFMCIYLAFLSANPDAAGVMGGIDASRSILGAFR